MENFELCVISCRDDKKILGNPAMGFMEEIQNMLGQKWKVSRAELNFETGTMVVVLFREDEKPKKKKKK